MINCCLHLALLDFFTSPLFSKFRVCNWNQDWFSSTGSAGHTAQTPEMCSDNVLCFLSLLQEHLQLHTVCDHQTTTRRRLPLLSSDTNIGNAPIRASAGTNRSCTRDQNILLTHFDHDSAYFCSDERRDHHYGLVKRFLKRFWNVFLCRSAET